MNIGFVGNVPPPIGGAEVFLQGFLSRFVKPGRHTGTLLRWGRQILRVAPQAGVQRYAPVGHRERVGSLTTYYLFDSLEKSNDKDRGPKLLKIYRNQGARATAILKRHRIQLIHVHSLGNLVFAAIAAQVLAIPLIVTVHGMLEFKLQDRQSQWCPELADMVDEVLTQADLVIAVSDEIAQACIAKGAKRVEKLPCGIDTSFFSPPEQLDSPCDDILFVGSIREDIGVPLLIDAFERIDGALDCNLDFVGARLIDGSVIKKAESIPRIRFRGQKDAYGVRRALSRAKMVVLPSESEGLPLSILEAMSFKRPVLVSDTGGLTSLIDHGRNGFLIKERTTAGLAQQIQDVLNRDDLLQVGQRARSKALEFDIARVVDNHEEIYRLILS